MEDNRKLIIWLFAALLGSTGINQGIQSTFTLRADPYTKTMALEDALARQVKAAATEERLKLIEYRLRRAGINGVHGPVK